jgi:hypothetical protein
VVVLLGTSCAEETTLFLVIYISHFGLFKKKYFTYRKKKSFGFPIYNDGEESGERRRNYNRIFIKRNKQMTTVETNIFFNKK